MKTFNWINRFVFLLQAVKPYDMYHGTVEHLPASPKFSVSFCHRKDKEFQNISFLDEDG